jgi:hypothetical protein
MCIFVSSQETQKFTPGEGTVPGQQSWATFEVLRYHCYSGSGGGEKATGVLGESVWVLVFLCYGGLTGWHMPGLV